MSLRAAELTLLEAELNRELAGAAVQKVSAPTTTRLFLDLRVPGRTVTLHLCADAGSARVSVLDERPQAPDRPPAWQSVLRRELTGARLLDAEALADRRTFLVHLKREARNLTLVLELGTAPGLALVDQQARVLALSTPFRAGAPHEERLRVGGTWTVADAVSEAAAAPAPGKPSRLSGDHVHERLLRAAETLFASTEREAWLTSQRAALEGKLKKLARTREKVRADAARTDRAQQLRREGELLTHNLHLVTRGATSVTLTDYLPDGSTAQVAVPLDPKRTPKEEVEHRFHQYRRLLRGAEQAAARLATLDAEEQRLRAELAALDTSSPPPPGTPRPRSRQEQGRLPPYREYVGAGGHRIQVGRGAARNDELTFGVAKPWHLWLHARGVPGAHVVIPLEKKAVASSELLVDAAHLALHHSELKGELRGEVSWVPVKFVRRAGAPGAVTFTREKTLMLRVDTDRLKRLLATEVER